MSAPSKRAIAADILGAIEAEIAEPITAINFPRLLMQVLRSLAALASPAQRAGAGRAGETWARRQGSPAAARPAAHRPPFVRCRSFPQGYRLSPPFADGPFQDSFRPYPGAPRTGRRCPILRSLAHGLDPRRRAAVGRVSAQTNRGPMEEEPPLWEHWPMGSKEAARKVAVLGHRPGGKQRSMAFQSKREFARRFPRVGCDKFSRLRPHQGRTALQTRIYAKAATRRISSRSTSTTSALCAANSTR